MNKVARLTLTGLMISLTIIWIKRLKRMYRSYKPGMELDVSRAIRNKYLFDGNLKVADYKGADLTLKGELVDFRNESLRYDKIH